MNILGVSSDFHDSSAALLKNGVPAFSGAEERFSYQKHDPGFPGLAIDSCLRAAGLAAGGVDWVAYHEEPVVKLSRILSSRTHGFPRGFLSFARDIRTLMLGQLWVKLDIFQKIGISPSRVRCVPHHLSHAAYAFATSGFSRAAVLVVDAVGEWTSTTWFRARREGGRLEIEPAGVIPYPHSLGMLYSAFTGFLGFRVNDGECSVMALAAFGQPIFADRVKQILRAQADGTYEIDPDFFDFSDPLRLPLSPRFFALFGPPRAPRDPLPFSAHPGLAPAAQPTQAQQHYADVAASVQFVLEEAVLALCAKLKRDLGEENLCLAGGVALNSSMNGRVIREAGFREVHIPTDPGDGGGALGAALYLGAKLPGGLGDFSFSPYLGSEFDAEGALNLVDGLDIKEIATHRAIPTGLPALRGFSVTRFSDFGRLAEEACADLRAGKVVGWVQGRFESGPRALGNRSLLVDPANQDAVRRLSQRVKLRAPFRPYACSLPEESAGSLFARSYPGMRWMGSTQPVLESGRKLIPQAVHADGTTRPQLVSAGENPRFHKLLGLWGQASGGPALLNTSFNASGYPLVSSPIDALLMFLRTDIETLVLNDAMIRKRH